MPGAIPRLAVLVLTLSACAGPAQGSHAKDSDPCTDVELDVERVWSASVRAEFLGKGGSVGGETRESIATKLDDLSRDWVMLRRSVCNDHFKRQVIDQSEYAKRAACLDKNLQRQRSLIGALDAGASVDVAQELESIAGEIDRCGAK